MRKFTFAIDVDEVLRALVTKMLDVYNEEYDDKMKMQDVTEYKVDIAFPRIQAESGMTASSYFFEKHSKEMFTDSDVIKGAKDAIETLSKYGDIIIVTYQKNNENKIRTLEWLEKNGIKYDSICFAKDKSLVHADYMIDDNDWNFEGCNCKHGILISRPYNMSTGLATLREKSNCKTMERFTSLKAFAKWFENNKEILEKYE